MESDINGSASLRFGIIDPGRSAMSPTATANGGSKALPLSIEGDADHWNHHEDNDYYSQPGRLFRLMTAAQRKALFENTARAMGDAPEQIKLRHIGNCTKADPAYGEGVAEALGLSVAVAGAV